MISQAFGQEMVNWTNIIQVIRICAVLRAEGTKPEVRDECTMSVINGDKDDRQAFTKCDWKVEDLGLWMRADNPATVGSV